MHTGEATKSQSTVAAHGQGKQTRATQTAHTDNVDDWGANRGSTARSRANLKNSPATAATPCGGAEPNRSITTTAVSTVGLVCIVGRLAT